MKINIQTKDVILTAKQKSMIERKISKMKRYVSSEVLVVDVMLTDETSSEKGGIDQAVHINATFGKDSIFIKEIDNRLMRAFAKALKRFERQLSKYHQEKIDKVQRGGGGRFDKLFGVVKRIKIRRPRKDK
jgi:ribosomal subunit interface protein